MRYMKYVTIYHARRPNQAFIIKSLFEEHNLNFRILEESTNSAIPEGKRVQVVEEQLKKAKDILKQNGFLGTPEPEPGTGQNKRYWVILFLALLLVILFSILINSL